MLFFKAHCRGLQCLAPLSVTATHQPARLRKSCMGAFGTGSQAREEAGPGAGLPKVSEEHG